MVGMKPMRVPWVRVARTSSIVVATIIAKLLGARASRPPFSPDFRKNTAGGTPAFPGLSLRLRHLDDHALAVQRAQLIGARGVERFLRIIGERTIANVGEIVLDRGAHLVGDVRVTPHEFRRVAVVQAEEIVENEDLSVADGA